ncbi:MAG: hypothetical protein ACI9BW_002822 [Gammaproteobacteria bacterium]|jgi:hypothetical protein
MQDRWCAFMASIIASIRSELSQGVSRNTTVGYWPLALSRLYRTERRRKLDFGRSRGAGKCVKTTHSRQNPH